MFEGSTNAVYILVSTILILIIMGTVTNMWRKKQIRDRVTKEVDKYDSFVSDSGIVARLSKSVLVNKIGRTNERAYSELKVLFDKAKNPWGITPTIFRFIRISLFTVGLFIGLFLALFFKSYDMSFIFLIIGFLGWWYPSYYYKAVAKEREQEWDKIYEFIWIIKNSSMLYDAKKVCLETRDYIQQHYPHHKELIQGFTDFHEHWDEDEIPEYILRHYNFSIPKELYTILYNMNLTGTSPDQNLDNLRAFALNRHNHSIQSVLSGVPSKATLGTLPFLMISVVIALLIPMIQTFLNLM